MRRVARRLAAAPTVAVAPGRGAIPAYKKLAPADLRTTSVDAGFGTGPGDEVRRTAPNQPLRDPTATVDTNDAQRLTQMLVTGEPQALAAHWLQLGQWFGPERLMVRYIAALRTDAAPQLPGAQAALDAFENKVIVEAAEESGTDAKLQQQSWRGLAKRYAADLHLFDSKAFVAHLDKLDAQVAPFAPNRSEEVATVARILRNNAVVVRNNVLSGLQQFVEGAPLDGGQLVWRRFFAAVEAHYEELVACNDSIQAMWECTQQAPLPALKPAAALLFACVSTAYAEAHQASQIDPTRRNFGPFELLTPAEMQQFVAQHVDAVVTKPDLRAFHRRGLVSVATDLAANAAHRDVLRKSRAESFASLVPRFADKRAVTSLLKLMVESDRSDVRRTVFQLLGAEAETTASRVEQHVNRMAWESAYPTLAARLLSDTACTDQLRVILSSSLAKKEKKAAYKEDLMSMNTLSLLDDVCAADRQKRESLAAVVDAARQKILRHDDVASTMALLDDHGISTAELRALNQRRVEARVRGAPFPEQLYAPLVREVIRQHPKWAELNIIDPSDATRDPVSAASVSLLLRIYLRTAYTPATGNALLKSRFRRRVGQVARDKAQHNMDAEIGFAEYFDMQDYKRYDWQGWYQRMVDVQNRNVSIRCRLAALRTLDAKGKPFIDLQTERRLRILAGDRVGNSIIKLDNDRFEDQKDNLEWGTVKLQDLLSESKKAQLGEEYWPTVEVKVRRPSGQSKMLYSLIDYERVEKDAAANFEEYKKHKASKLFVPPTDTWLKLSGGATTSSAAKSVEGGYSVDALFDDMDGAA